MIGFCVWESDYRDTRGELIKRIESTGWAWASAQTEARLATWNMQQSDKEEQSCTAHLTAHSTLRSSEVLSEL